MSNSNEGVKLEPAATEYTEAEQEALDSGWNPEGKDKDGNTLNADEYMARKPLFNKIHNLRNDLDEIRKTLSTVQGDSKKMAQTFIKEKENLLEQLKAQKDQALTDLDTDEVRRIDKQIDDVSQQAQEMNNNTDWEDSLISFVKENEWYGTNAGLKQAADIAAKRYVDSHPDAKPQDVYDHMASWTKEQFPDQFKEAPPNSKVSSSNRRTASKPKTDGVKLSDLDAETQKVVQVMAKATDKSVEDYLKTYER